jgi:hypothetical protein
MMRAIWLAKPVTKVLRLVSGPSGQRSIASTTCWWLWHDFVHRGWRRPGGGVSSKDVLLRSAA